MKNQIIALMISIQELRKVEQPNPMLLPFLVNLLNDLLAEEQRMKLV